ALRPGHSIGASGGLPTMQHEDARFPDVPGRTVLAWQGRVVAKSSPCRDSGITGAMPTHPNRLANWRRPKPWVADQPEASLTATAAASAGSSIGTIPASISP